MLCYRYCLSLYYWRELGEAEVQWDELPQIKGWVTEDEVPAEGERGCGRSSFTSIIIYQYKDFQL